MERTILGRTGLSVSIAGLGCGGHSRLGKGYGAVDRDAICVVRAAIESGVNFIDTARSYGTEEIVGQAIAGHRDQIVISTKSPIVRPGSSALGDQFLTRAEFVNSVEASLKRLATDYIDILHLHGVMTNQYKYCRNELVPAMLQLRRQGKIRFLGLTERFIYDPQHTMLEQALNDDCWDVVMVGFNMINQSARQRVFARTTQKNIGVLNMFAVRRALSRPGALSELVAEMIESGLIDPATLVADDPLGFVMEISDADTIVEAAYRYCRHEPGTDVILSGTGSIDHLAENLMSMQKGPLPKACLERLQEIFGEIDSVSGE
ncbi:MAG: aldo/keto reductase [Desulfobulbia bacterium]